MAEKSIHKDKAERYKTKDTYRQTEKEAERQRQRSRTIERTSDKQTLTFVQSKGRMLT